MTSSQSLSSIRKVPLRTVWSDEARDFTPWLAENIAELNMTLGMSLKVEGTEVQVGTRYIDILATDTDSGRPVVIENQLENSDGDHFSRTLFYAASKDADTIIWIAREFEEEHWLTLKWLNQRTGSQAKFFGIAVEVWSIDGSPPAPHFRVVVAPDDWRRGRPRRASRNERREFWQALKCKLEQNNLKVEVQAEEDLTDWWFTVDYIGGVRYAFDYTVDSENGFFLALQLDTLPPAGRNLEWCREALDLLKKDKESIEERVGSVLEWDREWGTRGSRTISYYPFNFYDLQESSDKLHTWAVEQYSLFRGAFDPKREELDRLNALAD